MSNNNSINRSVFVDEEYCRPKKCKQECKKSCPVVRMGKLCIDVNPTSKSAVISEDLCIGCQICVKKCPFNAIRIIDLPKGLENDTILRYGTNSFKLHRLSVPQSGQILGVVGANGVGKSTMLKILGGKLKPNFGVVGSSELDWPQIISRFQGSELETHFIDISNHSKKIIIKPQYIDYIPRSAKGTVSEFLKSKDDRNVRENLIQRLELQYLLDRNTDEMGGGELQRFAIAVICVQKADIYMFDEPSSYLDIRQRLIVAKVIRELITPSNCIVVVDHDLSFMDYLCDSVCCLYGVPGSYGIVSAPFGVREGINVFLDGYLPDEQYRFRNISLSFFEPQTETKQELDASNSNTSYSYPELVKTLGTQWQCYAHIQGNFSIRVMPGTFSPGEIIVLMGQNGVGKTTFIRMLAKVLSPDNVAPIPNFMGTIGELFKAKINTSFEDPQFRAEVIKPLGVESLMQLEVRSVSGSELQRIALVIALGKPADVYLLDEPSAYLDCTYRIIAAKIIKRFVRQHKKSAFVVEHDFTMATYLADRIIVYEGEPCGKCIATEFLKSLDVTAATDTASFRPRINKLQSSSHQQQQESGNYFIET